MTTTEQLKQVFSDNFVAYFRSHVAHVNIQGRNFYNDHKLLGKIYEDLQGQIDLIAELIRSLNEFMPTSIGEVVAGSEILDMECAGTADQLLMDVQSDLMQLRNAHQTLITVADEEGLLEISNYAQDRVLALNKFLWMLDSTLS